MKKLFHKAITVLGTCALIGATMGSAVAASYADTFGSDSAIVIGSAAASSDTVAAVTIANDLGISALGATTDSVVTVGDGDSFTLEKSSDSFNFNDALNSTHTTLDEDEMSEFLADGTYDDGDVEED